MDGSQYNKRSPAVKRLMREAHELSEPTSQYFAQPLEDNLFEWHFTVRGQDDSDFQGGYYHGRIVLPTEYPMKPPNIIILTPNGRFEVGKKICLSISGHHPESWQPSWSIRTALLAIIGFMPTPGKGTIGSLDYSPEERRTLAKRSQYFKCDRCGMISALLKRPEEDLSERGKHAQEATDIAETMDFKGEEDESNENANSESISEEERQKLEQAAKEKQARKAASLRAQQRFRERLNLPPPKPRAKAKTTDSAPLLSKSSSSSSSRNHSTPASSNFSNGSRPNRRADEASNDPQAHFRDNIVNRENHNHNAGMGHPFTNMDVILLVLVVSIAILLYRRYNWHMQNVDNDGTTDRGELGNDFS